jgi:hypothetical protein
MYAGGSLLSPNPTSADASACCCCKDKIDEGETRDKSIIVIVVMAVTNMILESRTLFVVLVILLPCNQKFIHVLDT